MSAHACYLYLLPAEQGLARHIALIALLLLLLLELTDEDDDDAGDVDDTLLTICRSLFKFVRHEK